MVFLLVQKLVKLAISQLVINLKMINKRKCIKKLKPLLEDPSIKKIGQNIKFDFIVFYRQGIQFHSMEDTMLMSYVLDAGKNRHNMDTYLKFILDIKQFLLKKLWVLEKKK